MPPRRSLRLTVATFAGLAVLVPAAAHAERVVVVDAAGDVQKLDWERSGKDDPKFLPAPDETSVDVVRTVVAHGRARLEVTARFRDLTRVAEHETRTVVVTPDQSRFDVRVTVGRGGRLRTTITRDDRAYTCQGLRAVLDVGRDSLGVRVPTACLGAPRWVRVGVMAGGIEDTSSPGHPYDFEMYSDDANSDVLVTQEWPVLGPKVRRG
jgi:hypothetical protein